MKDKSSQVFYESEIGEILNRAAELQGNAGGGASGLTVEELQEIAAEADIDPRFVSAAVLEMLQTREKDEVNLWGGPTKLSIKKRIHGHVSEEAWKRMVSNTETRLGKSGELDQWDNVREWVFNDKKGTVARLMLRQQPEHTDMELFWNEKDLVNPHLFIAMAPFIAWPIVLATIFEGIGASGFSAFGIGILIAIVFASISRFTFGISAANWRKDIRAFAEHLKELGDSTSEGEVFSEASRLTAEVNDQQDVTELSSKRLVLDEVMSSDEEDTIKAQSRRTKL